MKKILVACGTGMATSTMIAERVKEFLEEEGVSVSISQCMLNEVSEKANSFDLIITSMKIESSFKTPCLVGTPFLIGIGEEPLKEKILAILKD